MHLPLLQNPSKVVQDVLRRRDGDKHQPAGPLLLGRQLVVGNCTCVATQHAEKLTGALDGAADNSGQGRGTRRNMSGKNSAWEGLMLTRAVLQNGQDHLKRLHMFDFLHEFYTSENLEPLTSGLKELRTLRRKRDDKQRWSRKLQYISALHRAESCALSFVVSTERLRVLEIAAGKLGPTDTAAQSALAAARQEADDARLQSEQARRFAKAARGRFNARSLPVIADAEKSMKAAMTATPAEADARMAAAEMAAQQAARNARDAARSADEFANNYAAAEIAAQEASAGRARQYGRDSAAEIPAPRARPAGLNTEGCVYKSRTEAMRLFKRKIYDALLVPVLGFQRFIRWILRSWCAKALASRLKHDAEDVGKTNGATLEQVQARQEHVLNFKCKLGLPDRLFGDRKAHVRVWVRRERMRKFCLWGATEYGNDWLLMGSEMASRASDILQLLKEQSEQSHEQSDEAWDILPRMEEQSHEQPDDPQWRPWRELGAASGRFRARLKKQRPSAPHQGVSMNENPAAFWPCCDMCTGPNGKREETGTCRHCVHHGLNNAAKRKFQTCDPDYMTQLVSTVTTLHSAEVQQHLQDAVDFILWPGSVEHSSETPLPALYRKATQLIDENAHIGNGMSRENVADIAGWTEESGSKPPATCAQVRWHTTQISNDSLHRCDNCMAAGLICAKAAAKDDDEHAKAIASPFSTRGFVADDYPTLGTTEAIGNVIKFLTAPQAKAQRAIMSAIYKLITRPLIVVTNNKAGGTAGLMGVSGLPRRLIRILLEAIWLSTGTRERRHAMLHRTHGTEMKWAPCSLRILNPRCADKLRQALGEDWDAGILEAATNSISELISDFHRITAMPGWPVPDTTTKIHEGIFGRLYHDGAIWDPGFLDSPQAPEKLVASRMIKMCLLQFTFWLVAEKTAAEILDAFRYYIFSPESFAVGMKKTTLTLGHVRGKKRIRAAHPDALASAAVFFVMGRDLLDHYRSTRLSPDENRNPHYPLNFFPLFAATLWGEEGSTAIKAFGGVTDRWEDETGWAPSDPLDHFYQVEGLMGEDEYGGRINSVLVGVLDTGLVCSGSGRPVLRYLYRKELPKPLSKYPLALSHVEQAEAAAVGTKDIEQPWARADLIHETRKSQTFESLSGHFTTGNITTMCSKLVGFIEDQTPFKASMEAAMMHGWKDLYAIDRLDRAERKDDYRSQVNFKKGISFWTNNHQHLEGSHRGDRWLNPTLSEQKALLKLVQNTAEVMGRKSDVSKLVCNQKQRMRRKAVAKQREEPMEANRREANSGSVRGLSIHEDVSMGGNEGQFGGAVDDGDREHCYLHIAPDGAQSPGVGGGDRAHGVCDAQDLIVSLGAVSGDGTEREGSPGAEEGGEGKSCSADSGESGTDSQASDDDSESVENEFVNLNFDENPWSVQFALDCFNSVSGMRKNFPEHNDDVWLLGDRATVTVETKGKEARVKRLPTPRLTRCLCELKCNVNPTISFEVEQHSPKMAYFRFSDFAGIQYIYIERIRPPTDTSSGAKDWSATMEFRILSTTAEALLLCNSDRDEGVNIGKESLRKLLDSDTTSRKDDSQAIFHQGSTYCTDDIRTLIGVVRWYPAGQDKPLDTYWNKTFGRCDVLKMGAPFVQRQLRVKKGKDSGRK